MRRLLVTIAFATMLAGINLNGATVENTAGDVFLTSRSDSGVRAAANLLVARLGNWNPLPLRSKHVCHRVTTSHKLSTLEKTPIDQASVARLAVFLHYHWNTSRSVTRVRMAKLLGSVLRFALQASVACWRTLK